MGVLDIEPGSCDGMVKGANVGEDEFPDMIDIFDFPMESLEGGDDLGGGWDATKSQSLGPIPTEALMGLPPVPQGNMGIASAVSDAPRQLNSLGVGNMKPKQLPNYGKQSSNTIIRPENAQESGIFQTQSPVSVLETGGSCPAGKSLPFKPGVIIPVRSRSKRARASVFNPWFAMTPVTSATCAYKKAAGYKRPRGRKEKVSEASVSSTTASGITDESLKEGKEDMYHASDVTEDYETSLQHSIPMKKCSHCQVTKTPQWREGPMGPKTLCNACGVRYRSGRLYPEYRPLASPTFVPTLHSNSHRKVVEMRKKSIVLEDGTVQEAPMTPPTEFIPQLSNSRRKVLGTRNKATVHEKDFIYDASVLMSHESVPKRRKVMGMREEGIMQENGNMQENGIMQENNIMQNTFILPEPDRTVDPNVSTKFMGMRKKAIKQETDSIPDNPMSPAPEFIPMSTYLFDFIY